MKAKIILRITLAVWVIIWVIFLIRPAIKKNILSEYAHLGRLSTEEKRAYVTGEELYSFIRFCKGSLKEPSTYEVMGIEKDSIEHRRFKYYLYPDIETKDPEFTLVYPQKLILKHRK